MKVFCLIISFSFFGNNLSVFSQNHSSGVEQQQYINFSRYRNFYLDVSFWGSAQVQDITNLLDSVITDFYSNLDNSKINILPVFVLNSKSKTPPTNYPETIKQNNFTLIYLNTEDIYWSQYSYQFSHELCHYIIDTNFLPRNDKFGWLEESLCELAALYTLNKMSITWQTNPPYSNWRNYSISLKNYANEIISRPENRITKPFNMWLLDNLPALYNDRYRRTENQIIAVHLLPIFTRTPELWKIIHYIKKIDNFDNMTLEQYLFEWKKFIPPTLYSSFDTMINLLVNY
jgi:hypothetical protein